MDNKNVVNIHYGILYSCKEKWNLESIGKWVEIEKSELTQTQKDKYGIFSFIMALNFKSSNLSIWSGIIAEARK